MLRAGLVVRQVARGAAYGIAGSAAVGGTALAVYTNTQSGLGLRRELEFWNSVAPICFDYWWNVSSTSPKVKLLTPEIITGGDDKKELLQTLHQRNAPKIFQVMLDLGGLYIKLGQVLSVTALPIPEQYREHFRTLQSNVPGYEDFEKIVKPTLEKELKLPLNEIFESIEEIPCGAASIGQAHKATLLATGEEVIVKVQYPNAKWQVPADIECVGDFLKICVLFGLVDETGSKLTYEEFSRQFLSELDYERERENLQQVYQSSLDPNAPYIQKGVVLPSVYEDLCTKQVITMSFLPGPKFEEEAKRQLEFLGLDTKKGIRSIVNKAHEDTTTTTSSGSSSSSSSSSDDEVLDEMAQMAPKGSDWRGTVTRLTTTFVGVDSILSFVRLLRRAMLWSTVAAVKSIQLASIIVPSHWQEWAKERENLMLQANTLDWTKDAVYALLDVHGYQILNQGLFNADPHPYVYFIVLSCIVLYCSVMKAFHNQTIKGSPELSSFHCCCYFTTNTTTNNRGNIIMMNTDENAKAPKIGLIDYGQCKRLSPKERVQIAQLILSIANSESDLQIAGHFRQLGIQTKNNSTRFLAEFGRLMFGSFEPKHLDHAWHHELHKEDRVVYFPRELSMVYRTSLLLRGLAMSLQYNPSVGEQWRHHAQAAIDQYEVQP
jgi:aarF domain-containing kinase